MAKIHLKDLVIGHLHIFGLEYKRYPILTRVQINFVVDGYQLSNEREEKCCIHSMMRMVTI